jgi:hypothetical protein
LSVLVALIVLFEQWGWEPLQRLMARIAELPGLRHLESLIARLPPWAALVVLLLPSLLLVPVKLGALWLIGIGRGGLGVLLIVVAKVVGTAVIARLFTLTRPALRRLSWFEALYTRWVGVEGRRHHTRARILGVAQRPRTEARIAAALARRAPVVKRPQAFSS